MTSRLSVGMISNEIIHSAASRTGGFGYGTRVLISTVEQGGRGSVRFLTADKQFEEGFGSDERMAGDNSYFRSRHVGDLLRYKLARLDMLAMLDYRRNYEWFLRHRSRLPVTLWARDPRSDADNERFWSLREPGYPDDIPHQAEPPPTETLRHYMGRDAQRPNVFAVSTPYLRGKLEEAYNVEITGEVPHLCTVIPTVDEPAPEAEQPTVVALARLDPQKRPWLMWDIAREMPHVRFVMAGKTHAELRWSPTSTPDNLILAGELKGDEKTELLDSAWMLVNTAIHEALPVSWLETLGRGKPIVSCLGWCEDVPRRFGREVPFVGGVGTEMVPEFVAAIQSLIDDTPDRHARGRAGLEWVKEVHNADNFIRGWDRITSLLGVTP
jgi:glycosyltransferase involved in cell wall biosynthesis